MIQKQCYIQDESWIPDDFQNKTTVKNLKKKLVIQMYVYPDMPLLFIVNDVNN